MHYSDQTNSVRIDFFKESGKWYCTEAVIWNGELYSGVYIIDAFAKVLVNHLKFDQGIRLSDMTAICLEPYHECAHPLMMKVKQAIEICRNPD